VAEPVKFHSYRRHHGGNDNVTPPDVTIGRWGKTLKLMEDARHATITPILSTIEVKRPSNTV
jgi:hypothetical protein